jgi:hypothetical protein
MPSDLTTERMRIVSGSNQMSISIAPGTDASVFSTQPAGSIVRTTDGKLWATVTGGAELLTVSGTINAAIAALTADMVASFISVDEQIANIPAASVTGTMALSDVSPGGSVDLRISGTFDWLIPYSATPNSTTAWYGKVGGGYLFKSYQWFGTSGPSETDTRSWTMTADTKDSTLHPAPNGVLANMHGRGLTSLNHGYMFRLPCDPGWKRVIMQGTQHDDKVSLSASFSVSTAGSPQVLTSTCTNGSGRDYRFEILFNGPFGVDLLVKVLVEENVPAGGGGVNHLYCHSIACWRV